MNDASAVHVVCRHFAACRYQARGPFEDVGTNYKQHLREHHAVRHPRVEADEVRALTGVEDLVAGLAPVPRLFAEPRL